MQLFVVFKRLKYPLIIIFVYSLFVFFNPKLVNYRFNEVKITEYLRSQDIFDEKDLIKDRITISDSDIYEAAGYLYVNGADPREYNFQHPPLAKYFFGYAIKIFGNPYVVQIIFAIALLFGVYFLGKFLFKSNLVGLVASILLLFDPVFKEIAVYTLLDLPQITFFIWFLITYFFFPKRRFLSGILLGASLASKFYSPIIFYLGMIFAWKMYNKKFVFKEELLVLVFSFLVFSLSYFKSFPFNIFFHEAKIVKFMVVHDSASVWGSVIPMFFGGYFLWPLSFFATAYIFLKSKVKSLQFIYCLMPSTYLLVLCFQTPFDRYFILVLPLLYLALSRFVVLKSDQIINIFGSNISVFTKQG